MNIIGYPRLPILPFTPIVVYSYMANFPGNGKFHSGLPKIE